MLASFFLCFVCFQLTDFFHHLLLLVLQGLQNFNEDVRIVSRDSWLWLGSSPHSVGTFAWLGYCWWGIVGLDSACEGMTLIFCVVLDFGGICLWRLLSLSASQLLSGVTNLMWWAFFGWTGLGCLLWYWAQIFWVKALRPVQLQLNLVRLMRKLCLVC